ncbi:MAG: hypothetical protein GKS02_00570 [Alphaproteobacteria bacterium]|nr:hypothetical protein [Alphaproteobacteria bacterium]
MPAKLMFGGIAFVGVLATAMPALADRNLISNAYDGSYFGQRERIDPLSGSLCANHTLHSLTIENGQLLGDGGDIRGFIAENGFFSGTIIVFDLVQPFEGRIENGILLGGVVSPDSACFWLMRMTRPDAG